MAARPVWESASDDEADDVPEPWEGSSSDSQSHFGDDESDSDGEKASPGEEFVQHMLALLFIRKLTAQDYCVAMHWASEAGLREAKPWATPPIWVQGNTRRISMPCLGSMKLKRYILSRCLVT